MRADPATLAPAHDAEDIHLRTGFRKRKKTGSKTETRLFIKHLMDKCGENSLKIAKGNIFIHQQAFHLVEHGGMGQIGIAPVYLARCDNSYRRRLLFHGTDLKWRCMGS